MKIPKAIKIGSHEITVTKTTYKQNSKFGQFDTFYRNISLYGEKDMKETIQTETFLHEIMEGIKSIYNLEISHNDLTVISEQLFTIIRENKLNFLKGNNHA